MGTRILGTIAMVIGVIGIVLSVVGIIVVWWGVGLLRAPVNALADGVTAALTQTNEALDQLGDTVTTTQTRIGTFRENAAAQVAGASERAGDRLATALEDSIGEDYARLREHYVTLRERIVALDRMAGMANVMMRNRDLPALPMEQLQQVDQRVTELHEGVVELRTTLRTEGVPVPALLQQVDEGAGRIEQRLGDVAGTIGGVQGRVDQVGESVRNLQSTVHLWITIIAVVLTLLCVYGAFLHGLLFYQGRLWSKHRPSEPAVTPVAAA